jgi:hypothetical protein
VVIEKEAALLELIRWQGRGLRFDYAAGRGLLEACYSATGAGVPEDFLTASLCVLESAAEHIGASASSVRADFSALFDRQSEIARDNLSKLQSVENRLAEVKLRPEDVLLLGDPAVLLGLYRSLGAFAAQTWAVGIPGLSTSTEESVTEQAIRGMPFEVRFGWMGALEGRVEANSRLATVGEARWRVPTRDLLIVVLAARVGEPEASPASGTWAQLSAALKGMQDDLRVDEMLTMADELALTERAHRGLAIVTSVFPELRKIIPVRRLKVPAWERVAFRVAGSRLVKTAVAEDD